MVYSRFVSFVDKTNDGQLYAHCPLHDDSTPSFTVNEETGEWYCHGCAQGGHEKEFIAKLCDVDISIAKTVLKALNERGVWILPSEIDVMGMHLNLMRNPAEIAALNAMGISTESIEKYKLGWEDMRIAFPIFSRTGYCVNIRKYLPPHKRTEGTKVAKMLNIRGLGGGGPRLYPYEAFDSDEPIYIVEGEKDCLAARSWGINAVTGTGGSTVPVDELMMFEGHDVVLMTDNDSAGHSLAKTYMRHLKPIVKSLKRIILPVKDFSEYVSTLEGKELDLEQFVNRIDLASGLDAPVDAIEVSLATSESVQLIDTWIDLKEMTIVGVEPKVYAVPASIECRCNHSRCDRPCPLVISHTTERGPVLKVPSRYLASFVDSPDSVQSKIAKEQFHCKHAFAVPKDIVNVQKIIFQESASFLDGLEESSAEHRFGLFLYPERRMTATQKYDLTACRVADPRTQSVQYVIRDAVALTSANAAVPDLTTFREIAAKAENAHDLINAHYEQWLPTVGIEGRADLFGAILLTYCSVTEVEWQGGMLKGWLDTICIGDTRTGKSQMAQRFIKALKMGNYINGENARRTGVIGGVQQFGNSWVITWGAIPLNDRGLLMIDEASGLTVEDIKDLSSTRSSGAVTLNKIVKGEARARTRLLWFSNPRSGTNIEDFYWRGFGAFQEFVPSVEDQARFDLVISAARQDVETVEGINDDHTPNTDLWRGLVALAWSIDGAHIQYDSDFRDAVRSTAKTLTEKYGGGPLVVGVAVHEKLLRMSCAFAVLSGDIYEGTLQLNRRHLLFAVQFLASTLDKGTFAYGEYVRELQRARAKRESNVSFVRALVQTHPAIKAILTAKTFRGFQFQEVLGIERSDAAKMLSELIKKGLITVHAQGTYKTTGLLVEIARQMEVIEVG